MFRRPRTALAGAAACAAALVATGVLSHAVHAGRARDVRALDAIARHRDPDLDGVLRWLVHLADPIPYFVFAAAIVLTALLRSRVRTALVVAAILVAAPLTAEVVKHATAQARAHSQFLAMHIADASWPSGHATGAVTLALCAMLVAAPAWRVPVGLVSGALAIGVGYAVVALAWHYPSDTIGGFLVAVMWTLLGVALLQRDAPGSQSGSLPLSAWLAPRLKMNSKSLSRFR